MTGGSMDGAINFPRRVRAALWGGEPSPASKTARLSAVAGIISVAAAMAGQGASQPTSSAGAAAVAGGTVWLDQNWSARDRAWYHHAGQGTATVPIPYEWFMALEQPDSNRMFADPAYLDQFGF